MSSRQAPDPEPKRGSGAALAWATLGVTLLLGLAQIVAGFFQPG